MKAGFDHGLRLALYQPDIPQNAGTMLRTCACLGVGADLIEPAGFPTSDRHFRRAGMDYLETVSLLRHASFAAFEAWRASTAGPVAGPRRLVLLTTAAETDYRAFAFPPTGTCSCRARVGRCAARGPCCRRRPDHDPAPARLPVPQCRGGGRDGVGGGVASAGPLPGSGKPRQRGGTGRGPGRETGLKQVAAGPAPPNPASRRPRRRQGDVAASGRHRAIRPRCRRPSEMAPAIAAAPVSGTGTTPISAASASAERAAQRVAAGMRGFLQQPDRHRRELQRLPQHGAERSPSGPFPAGDGPRHGGSSRRRAGPMISVAGRSGLSPMHSSAEPLAPEGVAQWRRQRVDATAFEPSRVTIASPRTVRPWNERLMPFSGWPSNLSRNGADHVTVKPQLLGFSGSIAMPSSDRVAAQFPSEPSCGQLAPRAPGRLRRNGWRRARPASRNRACRRSPNRSSDAGAETPRPRRRAAATRHAVARCLERSRKDPSARADERLLAETSTPGLQIRWREPGDGRAQECGCVAVAIDEAVDVLAMGQVQAAAAGEQELASGRGHAVVERHPCSAVPQHLGGHEPGRSCADHGDSGIFDRHGAGELSSEPSFDDGSAVAMQAANRSRRSGTILARSADAYAAAVTMQAAVAASPPSRFLPRRLFSGNNQLQRAVYLSSCQTNDFIEVDINCYVLEINVFKSRR